MYVTYSNYYSISIVMYTFEYLVVYMFEYLSIPSINQLQIFFSLLLYTSYAIHHNTTTWNLLLPILGCKHHIFMMINVLIFWSIIICVVHMFSCAEGVMVCGSYHIGPLSDHQQSVQCTRAIPFHMAPLRPSL